MRGKNGERVCKHEYVIFYGCTTCVSCVREVQFFEWESEGEGVMDGCTMGCLR